MSLRQMNTESARQLRRQMTPAEKALWEALRDRQLNGWKFRRQVPFGPFVADFACLEERIVVEVDGGIHDEQIEQDEYRSAWMSSAGYRVIRFRNEDVLERLAEVLEQLRRALMRNAPPLSRKGEGAGG